MDMTLAFQTLVSRGAWWRMEMRAKPVVVPGKVEAWTGPQYGLIFMNRIHKSINLANNCTRKMDLDERLSRVTYECKRE